MVCLYIPVEIVFLALGKDIQEFLTYEDSRIQEVTIQRKHFSSVITPLFDKITHKLATIKKSKTLHQYPVEVICLEMNIGRMLYHSQNFWRGLRRSILLSLQQLKLIPEKVVVFLLLDHSQLQTKSLVICHSLLDEQPTILLEADKALNINQERCQCFCLQDK